MKNLPVTLLAFAVLILSPALRIQAESSNAGGPFGPGTAPVISEIFEVIIGDVDGGSARAAGSVAGTSVFVFPDSINLLEIVFDDSTPTTGIKWSFLDASGTIQINGVESIGAGDPTAPPSANRIDLNDNDPGDPITGSDGDPFTITFRNVSISPDNTPNAGAPTGELGNVVVTLFASDCTTFSARSFTVRTVKGSTDSVSQAIASTLFEVFFTGGFQGWSGGILNPYTGGTVEPDSGLGLCMTVPAAGLNYPFFVTPERFIDLTANTVYRARIELRLQGIANPASNTIPTVEFTFDSFTADGGVLANNYGGFAWLHDTGGGTNAAYGISRASGRELFDFYFAPPGVNTATWNATAFLPEHDPFNDMRLAVRVNDVSTELLAENRRGTICVRSISISSIPRSALEGSVVDTAPINASNFDIGGANNDVGTATVIDLNPGFKVGLGTTGGNQFTLVRDLGPGASNVNLRFFPVQYTADTLYRVNMGVRMFDAAAETDKPDALLIVGRLATNEKGFFNYTIRGAGTMLGAGMPSTTSQVYEGYLQTENVTNATATDADRLHGGLQIRNSDVLFGNSNGAGAIVIDSYSIEDLGTLF